MCVRVIVKMNWDVDSLLEFNDHEQMTCAINKGIRDAFR
jgi:hypothetical protein